MSSTHLDDIAAIIRCAEAEAYERGKADAKREMLMHLTSMDDSLEAPISAQKPTTVEAEVDHKAPQMSERPAESRKRAPRGTVRKFVCRVLEQSPGITAKAITQYAADDFERMIRPASIRSELRSGRDAGRYRDDQGQWFLVRNGKAVEAEDPSSKDESSASVHDEKGGDSNAAALNMFG